MTYLKCIFCFVLSCFFWSSQGIAAKNPINWALNQTFPSVVYPGINYTVTYTFTNTFKVQLNHPLVIGKSFNSNSEFTYVDTCTGNRLGALQSCTVQIFLTPLYVGEKTAQISIQKYDRNVVYLPQLITLADTTQSAGVLGAVTQALPSSMQPGTSANYIFTFTNYGDVDATNVMTTITQTTGTPSTTATCTGTLSKNGGTCIVQGSFTPSSSTLGEQSVQATLTFNGASGNPAKSITSTTVTQPNALIKGSIIVPYSLPPLMTPGGAGVSVQFLFSNVSSGSVTLTDHGTITCSASDSSPCSTAFTTPVSQCNASLSINQACSLTTVFTPPVASNVTYTLTAQLGYVGLGNPASIATSGTVVTSIPGIRTIQIVNNCGFTLSYSLNGAALPASAPTSPCPLGSTLSGGSCWWNNYNNGSNILATSATATFTIPNDSFQGVQWSGNISASTGCAPSGGSCTQATCGNSGGTTNCAIGSSFSQPATQAEFTMLVNAADSYDVETINGFHIPISITPYYVINSVPAPQTGGFSCGIPGNYFTGGGKTNGFGSCNWQTVSLPTASEYYYMVGGGTGAACTSSPCTGGELCGLSQPGNTGPISTPICGNFLGYWTPNQLCVQAGGNLPSSVATALQCNTSTGFNLSPPDTFNNTYTSLMACPVTAGYTGPTYNSCYTTTYPQGSNVAQCCGCVDWWDPAQTIGGVTILANTTSTTCPTGQTDPLWTGNIQGGIQWMKQACPSAYVYPFDDASSSFSCTNSTSTGTNTTSYVITFCPGNNGLPTGATEGRN